jgi:D-alanyl-D-alanine carboxypeptidase-like protein
MTASIVIAIASALVAVVGGNAAPDAADRTSAGAGLPRFHGTASSLDEETRKRMVGSSWQAGCPVGLNELRLLRLTYLGFDGEAHNGRLVTHEGAASSVLHVMRSLYRHRFPIRRMRLVDAYGADDHRSMAADNTSAFNCRFIAGQPGVWSQHAYGKAIDINPVENPYISGGHVSPPAGEPFADRSRDARGMVHAGDASVRAFEAVGWEWGGAWSSPKDYQHFSANGH